VVLLDIGDRHTVNRSFPAPVGRRRTLRIRIRHHRSSSETSVCPTIPTLAAPGCAPVGLPITTEPSSASILANHDLQASTPSLRSCNHLLSSSPSGRTNGSSYPEPTTPRKIPANPCCATYKQAGVSSGKIPVRTRSGKSTSLASQVSQFASTHLFWWSEGHRSESSGHDTI